MNFIHTLNHKTLSKLKKDDQFMILNPNIVNGIQYDNLRVGFVKEIVLGSIYNICYIDIDFELYYNSHSKDESILETIDSSVDDIDTCYLSLNDRAIELSSYGTLSFNIDSIATDEVDFLLDHDDDQYMHHLKTLYQVLHTNEYYKIEVLNDNINFYITIPINDICISIIIENKPNLKDYKWERHIRKFVTDHEFITVTEIYHNDIVGKLKGLKEIEINPALSKFFNEDYDIITYDIKDHIKKPENLQKLIALYDGIIPKEEIEKVFSPLYTRLVGNCYYRGYLKSIFESFTHNICSVYDDYINNTNRQEIELCMRITEAIAKSLRRQSKLHALTGEVIQKEGFLVAKTYEDTNAIIIKYSRNNNMASEYNEFYIKVHDIFIEANLVEKNEILDRIKLMKILVP